MNTACAASLLEHELRKEAAPEAQNNVFVSGNVGSDSYGQMLTEEMHRHHVCRDLVGVDEEKLTGLANILKVGSGESKILLQNSANDFVTAAQTRDRFSKFDPDALKGGLVCLQLESPVEPNLAALQQAHHFGMNTLLRPVRQPEGPKPRLVYIIACPATHLRALYRRRTRCPSWKTTWRRVPAGRRRTWESSARCWA